MSTLLAIETSADACSVAISCKNTCREVFLHRPREHNNILLPMIHNLLTEMHLALSEVDAIAFSAGPGSFTGLRLAAGVTQGLAFAAGKPVIPISTLAVRALSVAENLNLNAPQTLLIATDARMNDVYFGAYHYNDNTVTTLGNDALCPAIELTKRASTYGAYVKIGEGWLLTPEHDHSGQKPHTQQPRASALLTLAQAQYRIGNIVNAEQAIPVYLRENVSWQKWQPKSHKTL